MDAGYVVLIFLVGFIALMVLWLVYGISPIALLRLVFAVNDSQDDGTYIMSRSVGDQLQESPSSLQTDSRQTADRPMIPKPTPAEMLDIFRMLRAAGIKRETISGPWRAAGLPLDNDLWTKAKPADPPTVTPIAGRPTDAQFYDDPELEYQSPPR